MSTPLLHLCFIIRSLVSYMRCSEGAGFELDRPVSLRVHPDNAFFPIGSRSNLDHRPRPGPGTNPSLTLTHSTSLRAGSWEGKRLANQYVIPDLIGNPERITPHFRLPRKGRENRLVRHFHGSVNHS